MKATDLVKSLSRSSITSEDFTVVTAYQNQTLMHFLDDNFGCGSVINGTFEMPAILSSQDYLAVFNNVMLATPDGKSTFSPDFTVETADNMSINLYKFN